VLIDQAGHAVPGAVITATAVSTARTRSVVTGDDGGYTIPGLAPGAYRLRAELSGFKTLIREDVRLASGETVRVDLQLELGSPPKR
jgi:hypothetical protein